MAVTGIDPVICCSHESGSGTTVFDSPVFILGYQVAMNRSVLFLFLDFLVMCGHVLQWTQIRFALSRDAI